MLMRLLLVMGAIFLLASQPALPDMVRVTGQAAVEAGDEALARRSALEDALYQAALAGGAQVDGFSVVDQGVLTGESILLRPSSRILDFAIVDEFKAGANYEVVIDAYVGTQPDLGCAVRPDVVLTAVRPHIHASMRTPLWMKGALEMAHDRTLDALGQTAKIRITRSNIDMGAGGHRASAVQDNFDYQTLLTGRASRAMAPVSKLPEDARGLQLRWSSDAARVNATRVTVSVEARIIDPAAPSRGKDMRLRHTIRLAPDTPWRALNVVARKDQDAVADALADHISAGLVPLLAQLPCAPLVAQLEPAGQDRFRVSLGARDGLTKQSLAFAEGRGQAWTVFRVTELAQSSAIISPMNAARAPDGLAGVSVRFSGGMR